MLTRVYIDNFRCFVNFEWKPGRKQLILGRNGTGKSSFLDALFLLRQFAVLGDRLDLGLLAQRTRWSFQPQLTFELDARIEGRNFRYKVAIGPEPGTDPLRPRVEYEAVHVEDRPIFLFAGGEITLYNDQFERGVTYGAEGYGSALATIPTRKDNQTLTKFKLWFHGFQCFRINPFAIGSRAEGEHQSPSVDLSNFAAWYRHLLQTFPRENEAFRDDLRAVIDGFSFLYLDGEVVRWLTAEFKDGAGTLAKFRFDELSEGQRCLICLYAILHFVLAKGNTVIFDEPDNFIALREIQPWLTAAESVVEDNGAQLFVISHHPEFINQWASDQGIQFVREGVVPVRVREFSVESGITLSPAELVARGWELG